MAVPDRLSPKAAMVLAAIAEGHTYEQILALDRSLTYLDIFAAAREALAVGTRPVGTDDAASPAAPLAAGQSLEQLRRVHSRAYERWEPEEDARLIQLVLDRHSIANIAATLQRQPSAYRSRIDKLKLIVGEAEAPATDTRSDTARHHPRA